MTSDLGYQVAARDMSEPLAAHILNEIKKKKSINSQRLHGKLRSIIQSLIIATYDECCHETDWRKRVDTAIRLYASELLDRVFVEGELCGINLEIADWTRTHPVFDAKDERCIDYNSLTSRSIYIRFIVISFAALIIGIMCPKESNQIDVDFTHRLSDYYLDFLQVLSDFYFICLNVDYSNKSEIVEPKKEDING